MLDAIQELRLVLQAAVNIDISEVISQQMIERRSVFRYLGLVPEVFKGQNTRGIAVLDGLPMHRDRQHQSGEQKNRTNETGQASTVLQLVVPPDASYISNMTKRKSRYGSTSDINASFGSRSETTR